MTRYLLITAFLLVNAFYWGTLLSGCEAKRSEDPNKPLDRSGDNLKRYETKEVICFRVAGESGLWCQWKGDKYEQSK